MTTNAPLIVPVVLSGGSGTRLWPASRASEPKQLIRLIGDTSMMRATIDRVSALGTSAAPIIVTNDRYADATAREMVAAGYEGATLILEPVGRNTAPAVAVAAHEAMREGDPLMLILPADHTIGDEKEFARAITVAADAAKSGYLVTFGIEPSRPDTGYGYIKIGQPITEMINHVDEFREKPDAGTAARYVQSGDYLWNSGMFLMRASRYIEELERHAPDIAAAAVASVTTARREDGRLLLDADVFSAIRSDSIDYAVMERTDMAAVVPTDPAWSDVGSWESLWEIADKDDNTNVLVGDTIAIDTRGSYIRSEGRLIATIDLENVVVVDTPDAVLVANRESSQRVKEVVDTLRDDGRTEFERGATTLRPWGRFTTLESGATHRVLHLWLDPGGGTSLRAHPRKGVHWIVLTGEARITTGEVSRLVPSGDSVYIPAEELHRLENDGDDVLEVIEVDLGTYGGGDDIATHEDTNGRTERNG